MFILEFMLCHLIPLSVSSASILNNSLVQTTDREVKSHILSPSKTWGVLFTFLYYFRLLLSGNNVAVAKEA